MYSKRDLMTVLGERIAAIQYLLKGFSGFYGAQVSHKHILDASCQGVSILDPVIRMVGQGWRSNLMECAEAVLGEQSTYIAEVCPNAGWFVAEIESVIARTASELDPELESNPPFIISKSISREQLKTIRDSFEAAARQFTIGINAKFDETGFKSPFGL